MENTTAYNFGVSKIMERFPSGQWTGSGEEFCLLEVRSGHDRHVISHPFRFEGILMLYCIKGHIRLSVNLNEYEIRDRNLMVCSPGNIIHVTEVPEKDMTDPHYVVVAMSRSFAAELRMDMKKAMSEGLSFLETPVIAVASEYEILLEHYLALIAEVVDADLKLSDEALKALVSSMLNVIVGLWRDSIDDVKEDGHKTASGRGRMIFEQFVRLVGEYHMKHRNVGFYADKLCLTPKYLSKLIKTASGRSAPDWIDSYVILEAKHMLKYSDVTIKEIVYRLNFPNQSVFYKFFKNRTGMTPSEYRNS